MLELATRLGVDVLALVAFLALFLRRHRRHDLLVAFACFNLGFVVVLTVITAVELSLALAFGLFAVLSIVRLRSEPFDNVELGYYVVCLALALVNGIQIGDLRITLLLDAALLATVFLADHPALARAIGERRRLRIVLDDVFPYEYSVRAELTRRLGAVVEEVEIGELDYVRETTAVRVTYTPARTSAVPRLRPLERPAPALEGEA